MTYQGPGAVISAASPKHGQRLEIDLYMAGFSTVFALRTQKSFEREVDRGQRESAYDRGSARAGSSISPSLYAGSAGS